MYRTPIFIIAVFFAAVVWQPVGAAVDGRINNTFSVEDSPLDIAVSVDGKWIFVLAEGGKVCVFSPDGELNDEIQVDPSMDRIDVTGLAAAKLRNKIVLSSRKTGKVQEVLFDFVMEINTRGSPSRGPVGAPVVLALFTDFQCPYCSQMGMIIEKLLEKNPETIRVVIKNYPISRHKFAEQAARASLAADRQGMFWEFHDRLFENYRELSAEKIDEIAAELKLDMKSFKTDMQSRAVRQQVNMDMQDGRKAGVRGTPILFVNGIKVRDRSITGIQKLINEQLVKKQLGK